jgi:hypothetical protein
MLYFTRWSRRRVGVVLPWGCGLDLGEVVVRPVGSFEAFRYQELMQQYHYLGALPKISETLWYVATWREEWVALLSFSACALKCAARDRWIGWDFRQRYSRLKLVINNSRFLILPDWHVFNLGSRVLSLCQRRVGRDWEATFGHGVLLLETFVDPQRFRGTVYRAANWVYVGNTRGFRRTRLGYTATPSLSQKRLRPTLTGRCPSVVVPRLSSTHLTVSEMPPSCSPPHRCNPSLPSFPRSPIPRRAQGRRHRLSTGLGLAAGAVLCGMRGYRAISDGAQSLGQKSRERFGCRRQGGRYLVPSEYILRDVLIRVEPAHLDRALQRWNEVHARQDETLAIDGKTLCNALDAQGHPTHVMSVVGHQSQICYTQKK